MRALLAKPPVRGVALWQGGCVVDPPSRTLSNGYQAVITADRWVPGAYTLVVDGTPQSHVNVEDPTQLFFEYVQRMGHVIDQLGMPGEPITAVHLGAGALTLPRYIEATRPGSRQQVIELESALVDFVREELPWSSRASIRVRHGDARAVLEKLPAGLRGTVDLLVVDVFAGARTPAHVTSVEFYRTAAGMLTPHGILLANIADGPGLVFARGQAATLASVLGTVAALAETQVLKGRRFGNIVLVGSATALPFDWMPRLLAAGPHPAKLVAGDELREFIAGAPIVTDQTAVGSPPPSKGIFQLRPGAD
jgi:spermidine synthase